METILFGLKYSIPSTLCLGAFFALALVPRLYGLWKRQRPVTVSMPCADPAQARLRITEALKNAGQVTPQAGDSAFSIEPSKWQKKLGASTVFVSFPEPQLAAISGQSSTLKPFAEGRSLPLALSPNAVSFGTFLGGQLKRFYIFLALIFLIFFVGIAFGVPSGSTVPLMDQSGTPKVR